MDVKTICLGVLSLGDASGYEIRKQFVEGPFSHFYDAGFGSIYPALNALLDQGMVSCSEMEQSGRPAKKVYAITERGRAALREALHAVPQADKFRSEFMVMLFFAHLLDDRQLHTVYDEYLKVFSETCTGLESRDTSCAAAGQQFIHGLGVALYRAAETYMKENKHLLFGGDAPALADDAFAPERKTGTG